MNGKVCLRSVNVLSLAKMIAAIYALIGLVIGGCFSIFAMIGSAFFGSTMQNAARGLVTGTFFGLGAIVLLPILYGVGGFIGGLVIGAIYNFMAGAIGGVEFEFTQTNL